VIRIKCSPWFLEGPRWGCARLRLICFPYAGVGASAYRLWSRELPPDMEIAAIQPPGRESRFAEPAYRRIDQLAKDVIDPLLPYLDRPFAVFGHSMGAMVATEFVAALARRGAPMPVHLFVSARRALHLPDPDSPLGSLSDTEFIAEIQRRYGGIPAEVLGDRELLQLLLPGLRADIEAIESYVMSEGLQVRCPLSVFGGAQDPRASRTQLEAWRELTERPPALRIFEGDHFYLTAQRQALLAEIVRSLRPAIAEERAPVTQALLSSCS